MELEEMKSAWQRMDQLLQNQESRWQKTEVDRQLRRARRGLRPLFWGQVCQLVAAIILVLLAVSYWTGNRDVGYRLACGLVVHAYGVMVIVLSGITIAKVAQIDYSEPVTTIQKKLARLRSFYLLNGMLTGLPWWLLWIPAMTVLFGLLGQDLFLNAPGLVRWGTIGGILGLLGTWTFHRWAHHPRRAEFGERLDKGAAGGSLAQAQQAIREIHQFEME